MPSFRQSDVQGTAAVTQRAVESLRKYVDTNYQGTGDYVLTTVADATYLTIPDAEATYLAIADAATTYLDLDDQVVTIATTAPTGPVTGQLWTDSTTNRIYQWSGSAWVVVGGIIPGVRARRSGGAGVSVSSGANTWLDWDSEDYDTDGAHSVSTNISRLTCPTGAAGLWHVGYCVLFAAGTQTTSAWIEVNRGGTRFAWVQTPNDSTNGTLLVGTDFLSLAAGDYIEVRVFQNSGGNLTVAGSSSCSFWMYRVGPAL